jgi:Flp pilus assembly protein protease CpaA
MSPYELVSAPAFSAVRFLLLASLVLATVTDLRRRKILNIVTFPTALVAFIMHGAYGGFSSLIGSVLAYLSWFVLGFLFYRTVAGKQVGAGDIKMLMAMSACIGFMPAACVVFLSMSMLILWLFIRWVVQGTARANFAGLGRWLGTTLTPGTEKGHFVPVGMVDRTPQAPFMLASALLCYYLNRKGIFLHF